MVRDISLSYLMGSRVGDILAARIERRRRQWHSACTLRCRRADLPLHSHGFLSQWPRQHVHVLWKSDDIAGQEGRENGKRLHDEWQEKRRERERETLAVQTGDEDVRQICT